MDTAARMPRAAWLVAVFGLATGALLALVLYFLHREAVQGGEEQAQNLSQVIAEQTTRTLQAVDARLQVAAARLEVLRQGGDLEPARAQVLLRSQLQDLPSARAMWVVGPDGRVAFDSEGMTVGVSVADREYFQVYRRSAATDFYVGPLVRSRTRGSWVLTASRPLRDRDGRFAGAIVASLDPSYFEQPWRGVDLGERGAISLYHRSGQLIVRSPADASLMGRNLSDTALFTRFLPAAPTGVFVWTSPLDRVRRIVSYRVLPVHPQLVVAVGSGYAEVLAPWRRIAVLSLLVWAAAMLVAGALTLQLRRQAQGRRLTEHRFQGVAQAMPQIVFTADAGGAVQFVNQRWAEFTGRPPESALGKGWRDCVHPEDLPGTVESLAHGIATAQELEHELRLRCRDGSYRWQLLRAVPIREGGKGLAWYGTATDIDELKQAQARLHAQASLLKLAGRLARLGGWTVDLATQRITWSEQAAALIDLPPDAEPTLQEVVAMIAPASLPGVLQAMQDCIERGKSFDVEAELVTPIGRHVWVRSMGEPVFDAGGKVVRMHGAQQDITPRLRMLEEIRTLNTTLEEKIALRTSELARQEALFRNLAEQAPLPIWTVDPHGGVTFLSRAWYALAGGEPPQWHGYAWMDLIHPDDIAAVRRNWGQSARTGQPYAGTRRIRARDGVYHTFSYRAVPVRGDGGAILFWVGVDSDITEITRNQEALRLANEQLESFAYSVSHDLQSPLQRVQSFARLLEGELQGGSPRALHYLERLRANAATMAQLIEGLLELAQVTEVDMIPSTVNLSEIAAGILQRLQQDQPQRSVRWQVEPGMSVQGDVRLVRSMLENLIGNAWKFTAGKPDAEIVVGSRERGEYFVRDNGAGFDMAYADRLFGTFQRLHGADEFPGKGIGLASVARAASRQGGRTWAQGEPGRGATFYFTLPPA